MKKIILLCIPLFIYSQDLQMLLEQSKKYNKQIQAKQILMRSKQKELQSSKESYYPTLDVSAFYQRDDDATPFRPGTTYGARTTLSYNVYDGGKREYTIKQKNAEVDQKNFSYKDSIEKTALGITEDFYNILSQKALLQARKDAAKSVKKELERVKRFYEANLATSDDVDRLQSAYDRNMYEIESLKLHLLSAKKMLELKVGVKIDSLENSKFQKADFNDMKELSSIKALKASKDSLLYVSEQVDSFYYPNISLQDSFSWYGYKDKPLLPSGIEYLDNQNELSANIVLRVIDFGRLKEEKEAVFLKAEALQQQLLYAQKEQKIQLDIAKESIKTAQLNIKSAKSAYKAAQSALKTITKKYQAGLVDNVVYLDALANNTSAKALYEKSLNELEIAYARYYYYLGKELKGMLQ